MTRKILKKFSILIISSSLVITTSIVFACAYYDYDSNFYNSFFAPETSNTPESKIFYRSLQTYYSSDRINDAIHIMDSTNIEEWKTFFTSKVSFEDLEFIIYKSRIGEIDTCIFFLKDNKYPIKDNLKENTLLSFEDKSKTKEFLFYLGFAKRCEPFSTYITEWWNEDNTSDPRKDKSAMEVLLAGGKKAMIITKSSYLKERYAFQITRLLYQIGTYEDCVNFYYQNVTLFNSKSSIPYRALGYVAASQYKLKKYSEANYLYSLIFENCPPMRKISFFSFHPQEETDWQGALALAKNSHEKEVLWHLLGIYVDPLRAMQEIYKLNPKSNLLDLLIVRAVNINEESFIGYEDYWERPDSGYSLRSKKVEIDLLDFTQKLADAGNTNKPYLWNLTSGYLNLAQGKYNKAEEYLKKAESNSRNDILVNEQIHSLRIMIMVEQYLKSDPKTEDKLTKELNWLISKERNVSLRNSCIYKWSLSRLSEKYKSWGDFIKAQCLDYRQNLNFYESKENINSLIALVDKPAKTGFESFIIGLHPYSKETMVYYKAINSIYQYNFEEAFKMLNECLNAGSEVLENNPFDIYIKDCYSCDYGEKEVFTQYTFVKRMLELQNKIITDSKNASQYYFLLANGFYNMTYFGNSRNMYSSPIKSYGHIYFYSDYDKEIKKSPITDCNKALEYYQKAMDLSTDIEFKAKCCFMAAKCEQNKYFISDDFSYKTPIRSGIYFKQLRDNYSTTRYYQEVINECGYFEKYVSQKIH